MGTGIYKIKVKNGQQVTKELTTREVKQYIMRVNKWTSEEYNKKYDIFKNKLRAFEAFERSSGKNVEKQSVSTILYKEAQSKARYGNDYKPSIRMQRIRAFTSISQGKALQKALKNRIYRARRETLYEELTNKQFKGLLEKYADKVNEINKVAKNAVEREALLVKLAEKVKATKDEQDRYTANQAIPVGEKVGSPDNVDFNINIAYSNLFND